jgi:hypothetical protein
VRNRRAHIKVSRRFFEEDAWWTEPRRFSKAEAWIDCIQMASWKPRRFAVGLTVEELERGEFMASLRYLAKRWRWGKSAVSDFLKALENLGRIAGQRKGQDGTVYLLVNYDWYQANDKPKANTRPDTESDNNRTATGQQPDKTEAVKAGEATKTTWLTPFANAWSGRCGNPPFGRLAKCLATLRDQLGEPEALARWSRYLNANEPKYCSPERFAATHQAYAEPETIEMTDDYGRMVKHRKTEAGEWVPVVKVS